MNAKSRNKEEYSQEWIVRYEMLVKDYKNGEDIFSAIYKSNRWIKNQRIRYEKKNMTQDQIRKLDSVSKFLLRPKGENRLFYEGLSSLKRFVLINGRKPLRNGPLKKEKYLANWIRRQKNKKSHTKKRAEEIFMVLSSI